MKRIFATSLLFACTAVAAQDPQPTANSPLPTTSLKAEPTPLFSSPPPTSIQQNTTPAPKAFKAPPLPQGNSLDSRFVEDLRGNTLPRAPLGSPLGSASNENSVAIRYMKKTPVQEQRARPDGTVETRTRMVYSEAISMIAIPHDEDIGNLDKTFEELEGDGKRAAIQAVTAHRHGKLLQALKDAKTEAEKEQAAKKLEANYRAHYASETKWRLDRLAELEKRLEEMRTQVKERAAAEEKFLEAAMTLAKLNAQGIAAEPPQLKGYEPYYGEPVVGSYNPSYSIGAPSMYSPTEPSRTTPLP